MTKAKTATKTTAVSKTKVAKTATRVAKTRITANVQPIGALTRKTDRSMLNSATWVVYRGVTKGNRNPMLFDENMSRDNVRNAYAKLTKTPFVLTRSRRLKNY